MGNICKERYHCDACCHGPYIQFSQSQQLKQFLRKLPPSLIDKTSKEGFRAAHVIASPHTPQLVIVHPDNHQIQLSGPCPLLKNGECSAFGQAYRPPACIKLQPGSKECNKARQRFNLPPINPEP